MKIHQAHRTLTGSTLTIVLMTNTTFVLGASLGGAFWSGPASQPFGGTEAAPVKSPWDSDPKEAGSVKRANLLQSTSRTAGLACQSQVMYIMYRQAGT